MSSILIVDDHPVVREGVAAILDRHDDLHVCGTASGVSDGMQQFHEKKPDLVVLDLSLQDGGGLEMIKKLTSARPDILILVQSLYDELLFAERVLKAGAKGYLRKEHSNQLVDAVRQVLAGGVYLSEELRSRMASGDVGRSAGSISTSDDARFSQLTDRELEVFELIGRGLSTRDVAERLHRSPKTIESYREHLKQKLRLKNAHELNHLAIQWVLENKGMSSASG